MIQKLNGLGRSIRIENKMIWCIYHGKWETILERTECNNNNNRIYAVLKRPVITDSEPDEEEE